MAVASPTAMVAFPASETDLLHPTADIQHPRQTYLPFRRISLPSAPNLQHRQSIVSTASFDSLPEEAHHPLTATPVVIKNAVRRPKPRPSSMELNRRVRRRDSRIVDERKDAKRRKVITEFYETERSYLDGLELIHSHFLTPIIASLETPHPLLERSELTSIFSNFIDIWNLHRSFYASLTSFMTSSANTHPHDAPVPLSPVLLSHFPYLSLYTPFVSSFSHALASYASLLRSNVAFANFIAQQEADPRCGKLRFRDWLLTIVQRCPRYLLLLKDMIDCTDPDDSEYTSLAAVHTLVSKITMSLNTSLHTHAQTLALLALQRNTPNLPFQLISPGRTFLKRTSLLQVEGSTPREREVLLFSDMLIWLASSDGDFFTDRWSTDCAPRASSLERGRTKGEAESDVMKRRESLLKLRVSSPKKKTRQGSTGMDERWIYKGHIELVDLEVVASNLSDPDAERGIELLSPHQSFVVYAVSEEERDEWITAIRHAKSSLLVSLNAMQLNSTLTSSSSTNHLRRALQALPYAPDDTTKPQRGVVEHFVPAVWVPDGKTESCMRCGRTFGWRRRRHHCRLCGRCVCNGCSSKTFYIYDPNAVKELSKPARACESCYDTVFPLTDPTPDGPTSVTVGTSHSHFTISGLKSMPSLLLPDMVNSSSPSALMAIDSPKRGITRVEDEPLDLNDVPSVFPVSRLKLNKAQRPKSYVQILEEFEVHGHPSPANSPRASRFSQRSMDDTYGPLDEADEEEEGGASLPPTPRRENTARKAKRFSLPAVALQTSAVTARPNVTGEGKSQRVSLVLGKNAPMADERRRLGRTEASPTRRLSGLRNGAAAGRLNELLSRGKEA